MLEAIGIALFVLGLLASIALHEIGHLVPAKKFGVRVTEYMVGFGPTLWSRTRGETSYGVKALPFGGYIRMVGMFPPSAGARQRRGRIGTMIEQAREDSLAEVAPDEHGRAFYNLSVPRKLTVMAGGPLMNLALSAVLFTIALSVVGGPAPTLRLGAPLACIPTASNPTGIASTDGGCGAGARGPARAAGLREGDEVVAIGGVRVTDWEGIGPALSGRQGSVVPVIVMRDGAEVTLRVAVGTYDDPVEGPRAFIGISPTLVARTVPVSTIPHVMWTMSVQAAHGIAMWPVSVAKVARTLTSSAPRDPNGPVSIVGVSRISGQVAADTRTQVRYKVGTYLNLLASMNLFLFLFNLLPLLPLDGGHIAGAAFEGLRRTVSRIRGRGPTGAADTAKLIPVAYVVTLVLIAMSLVVMVADVIKPISLG